tara:strand:+ start:96 stop:674 length:579 start_codon:yes stop_codon:yes gene_type:complete
MTIKINISPEIAGAEPTPEAPKPIVIELDARRTIDGNIMIMDHEDIDIVLMPSKSKCLALAKEMHDDKVYGAQDRLFRFLSKSGVIVLESIQSGNVYGSMEATIPESAIEGIDSTQAVLYSVYKYLQEEAPYFTATSKIRNKSLNHLLHPDDEHATDLGTVPHKSRKGSHSPSVRPYGYMYNYSLLREGEEE